MNKKNTDLYFSLGHFNLWTEVFKKIYYLKNDNGGCKWRG